MTAARILELNGYTKDARRLEEIVDTDAVDSERYRQAYGYANARKALRGKSLERFAVSYARSDAKDLEASYSAFLEGGLY